FREHGRNAVDEDRAVSVTLEQYPLLSILPLVVTNPGIEPANRIRKPWVDFANVLEGDDVIVGGDMHQIADALWSLTKILSFDCVGIAQSSHYEGRGGFAAASRTGEDRCGEVTEAVVERSGSATVQGEVAIVADVSELPQLANV